MRNIHSMRLLGATLFFSILLITGKTHAAEQPFEYEVKAAFLFNFAKFVEWPAETSTINLCILGENPFGTAINELNGKSLGNKKFQVTLAGSSLSRCNMIFIGASEQARIGQILNSIQKHGILTVGDTPGFARQGVMINFYLDENNKVKFEINPQIANRAEVKISSKLIQLGKTVNATP